MEADADAFKKEKDRLAQRQKTAENAISRLKNSLLYFLLTSSTKSITAGNFKVSLGNSEKINITNEALIPDEYFVPQPPKLDANGLKKAIKDGETIEGAEVIKSQYVTIR